MLLVGLVTAVLWIPSPLGAAQPSGFLAQCFEPVAHAKGSGLTFPWPAGKDFEKVWGLRGQGRPVRMLRGRLGVLHLTGPTRPLVKVDDLVIAGGEAVEAVLVQSSPASGARTEVLWSRNHKNVGAYSMAWTAVGQVPSGWLTGAKVGQVLKWQGPDDAVAFEASSVEPTGQVEPALWEQWVYATTLTAINVTAGSGQDPATLQTFLHQQIGLMTALTGAVPWAGAEALRKAGVDPVRFLTGLTARFDVESPPAGCRPVELFTSHLARSIHQARLNESMRTILTAVTTDPSVDGYNRVRAMQVLAYLAKLESPLGRDPHEMMAPLLALDLDGLSRLWLNVELYEP